MRRGSTQKLEWLGSVATKAVSVYSVKRAEETVVAVCEGGGVTELVPVFCTYAYGLMSTLRVKS
jgi:hypothetical protein